VPGAGPHDIRKDDPYDAAFFEHLGHISTLSQPHTSAGWWQRVFARHMGLPKSTLADRRHHDQKANTPPR